MILRGGGSGPNYSEKDVKSAIELLEKNGLHPSVMVDASHANCGKKQEQMPDVIMEIVRQRAAGNLHLIGAMVESNLVAGAQSFPRPLNELTYGQSITDECIDWAKTEDVVREAYKQIGDV
jgi:3-deoxy-7-phosphoheptulonate synthase